MWVKFIRIVIMPKGGIFSLTLHTFLADLYSPWLSSSLTPLSSSPAKQDFLGFFFTN